MCEPSLLCKLHRQPRGIGHKPVQRADVGREEVKIGHWKSTGPLVNWEGFVGVFFQYRKCNKAMWVNPRPRILGKRRKSRMRAALKVAGETKDQTE